jgi:hypothetical protein
MSSPKLDSCSALTDRLTPKERIRRGGDGESMRRAREEERIKRRGKEERKQRDKKKATR